MKDRKDILLMLTNILMEDFEIDAELITLNANLYTDLDLDSIDTVDLVIKLQDLIGHKIDSETFKSVRTIDDVLNIVEQLFSKAV